MKKPVEEKSGGPGGPFWRNKDLGAGWNSERTDLAAERSPTRGRKAHAFFSQKRGKLPKGRLLALPEAKHPGRKNVHA